MAAVAAQAQGFRTFGELAPALAFHAVTSVLGAQLLVLAARRSDAERPAVAAAATEGAPNS